MRFVGPLGDALSFETCVVYIKRDVVGVRALGKSKCHSEKRERRPHNRISVTIYWNIGLMVCDMFPTPRTPELAIYEPCSPSHFVTSGSA